MTESIKVHIPGELRPQVGDRPAVELSGSCVNDVLRKLAHDYPVLGKRLFNPEGRINRFVNIYLNDEDIRFLENLDTAVSGGDEISIVPAIAGG